MKPRVILAALAVAFSWSQAGAAADPYEENDPFWLNSGVGIEYVNMRTFRADPDTLSAGFFPTVATGPTVNLGAGVRVYMLSLGLRGGVAWLDDSARENLGSIRLWSIDAEAAFHILSARIEPYLLLGGGYSTVGGLDDAVEGLGNGLDVNGANLRLGLGMNLRATPTLSFDARVSGELLALSRRGVPLRDLARPVEVGTLNEAEARVLQGNGSSLGTALTFTVGPAVRF
jgi:hypothetical protein